MGFKKYDGSTWQPITPKKSKGIPYTGTLPATLTGTKTGYLHKYKIYGNSASGQECGERTANLFKVESGMLSSLNWDYNPIYQGHVYFINYKLSDAMTQELKRGQHTCSIYRHFTDGYKPNSIVCAFTPTVDGTVDAQYRILTGKGVTTIRTFDFSEWQDIYLTIGGLQAGFNTEADKQTKIDELFTNWRISIVAGSTAPESYIPYGYKLPLTSAGQNVDVYIGDDTLSDAEYVDSGTGKIYRMVSGVLTPVDPPTPFPQIPTLAGSTTISWRGEGLAPSEFNSIQEWVDIATYTYTNGEWV